MRRRFVLSVAALLLLALASSLEAQIPAGVLDNVAGQYRSVSFLWMDRLVGLGRDVFAILILLHLLITLSILLTKPQEEWSEGGRSLFRSVLFLTFWGVMIFTYEMWVPNIVDGFLSAASTATQAPLVSPSRAVEAGVRIFMAITTSGESLSILLNPVSTLTVAAAAFIMLGCHIFVAAVLTLAMVTSYIVLGVGPLFLAFAGWRPLSGLAEGFLIWVFRIGILLFLMHLMVGLGTGLAEQWATGLEGMTGPFNMAPVAEVLAGSIFYVFAVVTIPAGGSFALTSHASLGIANAVAGRFSGVSS